MADRETVIGPETRISGEVRGEEDLVVRGRIDGRVQLSETLTVDVGGIVQADVEVKALVVSGVLVGNIVASHGVRLTDKARVVGDVTSPRFVMDAGAAYRGRVETGEGTEGRAQRRAAAERPAPPRVAPPRTASTPSAPPRMSAPPATTVRAPAPPSAPPRVAASSPRPAAPVLPRPEAAASAASAPAWAKKKLRRR
jgi:cytoskeletal protein CcmA (bactofilin family)